MKIFILKKHAKWYQGKKFSGIFLASVCPLEYKNGQIFDRRIFQTSRVTLAHSGIYTFYVLLCSFLKGKVSKWYMCYKVVKTLTQFLPVFILCNSLRMDKNRVNKYSESCNSATRNGGFTHFSGQFKTTNCLF